jgi:tRNA-2-methylthio-N6-dimethylallyladenosine synthase
MTEEPISVCIVTFGCQMNKLDSELLHSELVRNGFSITDDPGRADVVLYNTCSVRGHAEDRVFSQLGSYRRRAKGDGRFVLGVIGCVAQRLGEDLIRRFNYVDLVCGTQAFLRVPEHLRSILAGGGPVVDVTDGNSSYGGPSCHRMPGVRESRHQAYVAVMRGCDNFCSYCIVPYVRGREASRRPRDIVEEVTALAADGVREVTLLGQNVNSYGRGLDGESASFAGLLALLNDVHGIERIRFITNHPRDMSDSILDAVARLDKVCEHLHVPAQSGSDAVLARMNRGYTAAQYRAIVARARELIPDVELSSDFMVGFPGETDADFEDTLELLRGVRFQQSFVFKYSPRPGTKAARWPDDIPDEVKRERNQILLAAQQEVDRARRAALVGQEVEVLVNGRNKGAPAGLAAGCVAPGGAASVGRGAVGLVGRTRQNDIVVFEGPEQLLGRLCRVRLTHSTALTLFGRLAEAGAPLGHGQRNRS